MPKLPFVSRIEFIRSKLSNLSAHVCGVAGRRHAKRQQYALGASAGAGAAAACRSPDAAMSERRTDGRVSSDRVMVSGLFWAWPRPWRLVVNWNLTRAGLPAAVSASARDERRESCVLASGDVSSI